MSNCEIAQIWLVIISALVAFKFIRWFNDQEEKRKKQLRMKRRVK